MERAGLTDGGTHSAWLAGPAQAGRQSAKLPFKGSARQSKKKGGEGREGDAEVKSHPGQGCQE